MEDDLQALRFKVRYLNCIDDTLKAPNEVWFHQDDNTFYYLKRYGDDVEGSSNRRKGQGPGVRRL